MYKEFHNIEDLLEYAKADKQKTGDDGFVANRYPIRFVLFDNFNDSFEFIKQIHCNVENVEKWLDADYPDIMVSHVELADKINKFIINQSNNDVIIAPFSELARFYNNKTSIEFDALIKTIKGIESGQKGFQNKQRIYIPIVGLEDKMSMFAHDTQINIWYLKNAENHNNYKLILTSSTFEIEGLEETYTIVDNVKKWMSIWRDPNTKPKIISTSKTLLANAEYAQPDNAFDFYPCVNVYKFLTQGLELDFGEIEYKTTDNKYWQRLAKEIDINHFSFDVFFNKYFHIDELADFKVFLKTWFDCSEDFEKWLLCTYYLEKFCNKRSYICQCIKNTQSYSNADFFASIVLSIFDCEDMETYIDERNICMKFAADKGIKVTVDVENQLKTELEKISVQQGFQKVVRYLTHMTLIEKRLIVDWVGKNKIDISFINSIYPDLYNYVSGKIDYPKSWVTDYFRVYRNSKIANAINDELMNLLTTQNNSVVSFNSWYNSFKTTKTILNSRSDIEVFYWIDGLGIEWIPFITYLFSKKDGIYLNETYIAQAAYPTTTSKNKIALDNLSRNNLKKIGDLDSQAHRNTNKYPDYIIEEFDIVSNAIDKIVSEYSGKKIAIVSDHGLTAMSQFCDGLNLAGYKSDHWGRLATNESDKIVADNKYVICDDNKTICALKHNSLCGKTPIGQSAHGGCTPEEILVPIFIVSAQKHTSKFSAKLTTTEITGNNPIIEFEINGSENVTPYILYNNKRYNLTKSTGNIFVSAALEITAAVTSVTLYIGNDYKQTFTLSINIGAKEDDLFDF